MFKTRVIAMKDGMVIRCAQDQDLETIDTLTILCYKPIHDSYVKLLGNECYQSVRPDPELTWEERKLRQVHRIYDSHPEWVWVVEKPTGIVGFCTFELIPEESLGAIRNNGVYPDHAGKGIGKWMYRNVLRFFRERGMRFAFVDTGLDDVHIPARKAYEAVGFDRAVRNVEYWQDLSLYNTGSDCECA